ncbi:MAG: ATP-binding protein [Succinivibrio sp.]|nr:ATP-binding protein [Succinivibrio sp.]
MLTVNSLSKLLSKGKSETFECREGKALTPRYITELYSAFANTYGGVLVLGIKEDPEKNSKERFTIVGVEDPAKIIDDFWNTINSAKVNVNLLIDSNVYPLTIDDKTVVVIEVPRADCTQMPVYVGDNPIKGTYRRNGSGDYHCIENEIKAMFRDQVEDPRDRKLFYPGLSINDLESESIKRYRQLFNTSHDKHAWSEIDDKTFF